MTIIATTKMTAAGKRVLPIRRSLTALGVCRASVPVGIPPSWREVSRLIVQVFGRATAEMRL
jgi:hypothetical protein